MVVDVTELYIAIQNYWSFCDVPGFDTSALALVRVIVCFVCTILAIPLTRRKPLGMFIGAAWVFTAAGFCEAAVEIFTHTFWANTAPNRLPDFLIGWTPQAVPYYLLIDASAVFTATVMCMVLGHMPMWTTGPINVGGLVQIGAVAPSRAPAIRRMLGGLDFFLYAVLIPFLFAAVDVWAAIFLVRYAAKPGGVFRTSALVITIISAVETVVVWASIRAFGVDYIALINYAAAENGKLLTKSARRATPRLSALANAGTRVNIVWGSAAATIFLSGALCWGKFLPGQYGLFFQPLLGLAISLLLAVIVRLILGIGRVSAAAETTYSSPNFFPGMTRHLMTNARAAGDYM
jgi:hypothetical protein